MESYVVNYIEHISVVFLISYLMKNVAINSYKNNRSCIYQLFYISLSSPFHYNFRIQFL